MPGVYSDTAVAMAKNTRHQRQLGVCCETYVAANSKKLVQNGTITTGAPRRAKLKNQADVITIKPAAAATLALNQRRNTSTAHKAVRPPNTNDGRCTPSGVRPKYSTLSFCSMWYGMSIMSLGSAVKLTL